VSTTTAASPVSKCGDQQSSTSEATHLVVPACLSSLRKSANGKQPRLAISAERERSDGQVRSRMQEARVALGQELYGDSLKTLGGVRLSLGYSQQQLATAIGTSQPNIARLEAGSINIMWTTGKRLAQALGLTLEQLDGVITATSKLATTTDKS
jgi:DNA-binding XRE family transcriptional regulator